MSGDDSWGFASDVPDGQVPPEVAPPDLAPGDRFGEGFELLEELGRGGFGVVFRAREAASGREVALKVLTTRLSERQRSRFRREGELTAALRHPGIVRIHSAGEVEGVPYLAYELLPGQSLKDAFEELTRAERVRILIDAARAVGHAHRAGVVHRDLKPENLLLDGEGRVRVADFGLARGEDADRLTQSGAMVGTPSHMAPEQWDTQRGEVSPATDVWALGAILYRCLTGEPPYHASNLVEMAAMVVSGKPRPPRELDPSVPPALEAVCLKALRPEAADRYPDASALADDLTNALAGRSTTATSAVWTRAAERGRRLLPLGLALLVLAAAIAYALRPRPPGEVELLRWMAEARDGGSTEALATGLAQGVEAPPKLRAEARLLLAARAHGAEALAQADAALALHPSSEAYRLRGQALADLERWSEAAEALRQAAAAGASPSVLLDLARLELRHGQATRAVEVCRAYLERSDDARPGPHLLLFRAQLAARQLDAAGQTLDALGPHVPRARRHLLQVELTRARGLDPEPLLREGVAAWPQDAAQHRALVAWLVAQGDLFAAREAAVAWVRAAKGAEAQATRRALAGLFTLPLRTADLPAAWRVPVAGWLVREAERELAFVARAENPIYPPLRGAPPLATRQGRARAWLEAALALDPAPDPAARTRRDLARLLVPGAPARVELLQVASARLPDDPLTRQLRAADALAQGRPAEAERLVAGLPGRAAAGLRGRAWLALGRLDDAVEALQRASHDRLRIDVCTLLAEALKRAGRTEELTAIRERIARLRGARKKEAWARYQEGRAIRRGSSAPRVQLIAAYEESEALAPLLVEPRFELAKLKFVAGQRTAGLSEVAFQLERAPYLLDDFQRNLLSFSHGLAGETGIQHVLGFPIDATRPPQRRARLIVATGALEYEGRGDLLAQALADADALLTRDPAEITTRILRGFLNLRAGHLARAEHDLAIAREAAPQVSATAFYQALLAARRRRPLSVVRALLARARKLDFDPWNDGNWHAENYPEMKRLRSEPDIDHFSRDQKR